MALLPTLIQLLITFVGLVILAIPLYLTVGLLGGKTGIVKAIATNLLMGFLFVALRAKYPVWGFLLGFLLTVWLFHELFRLKWWKALVAFFLQFVVLVVFWFLAALLLAAAGYATGLVVSSGILH